MCVHPPAWLNGTRPRVFVQLVVGCFLLAQAACHRPAPAAPATRSPAPCRETTVPDQGFRDEEVEQPPERVVWPADADDPEGWLHVEGVRGGAEGAWATGSFNPKRNKLDIHTHDVRAFAIDTERIRIDWEQIVILGIDDANSELRRRNFRVYHFELDDRGQWVVLED